MIYSVKLFKKLTGKKILDFKIPLMITITTLLHVYEQSKFYIVHVSFKIEGQRK